MSSLFFEKKTYISYYSNAQNSTPNVSIHVNHNGGITTTHITSTSSHSNGFNVNQRPADAFPALGASSVPKHPQWVQAKSKKHHEPKVNKVAPPPQLPPSDLSQFPSLSKNKSDKNSKKTSSVTVPVSDNWVSSSKDTKNKSNNNNNNNNNNTNKNKNIETSMSKTNDSNGDSKSKAKKNKKKNGGDGDNMKSDQSKENLTKEVQENKEKNGIVKKRSEVSLTLKESAAKPPPGFPAKPPPPGFSNFNPQNFPSLGTSNDLTFTSSSGKSYSIKPTNYHQPTNFSTRNQNLIRRSMCVLKDSVTEFKTYSAEYRDGKISADQYYEYCKALLAANFSELFPELLALLPDIDKQQELYKVCEESSKKNLIQCVNCNQVIFKNELPEHYSYHTLESQFPSLGKAEDPANVWKK